MLAHFETLSMTATISQLELLTRRRRVTPRAPRTYHPHMSNGDLHWIATYIWGIADDVLRDLYVRGKYRDVILPMTVLRRLDAVLVDSKPNVLEMKAVLDQTGVVEQDAALRQAAGQAFYNTSKFTLRDLRARASRQQLRADFEAYLDGFSPNVQDILENFEFRNQIPRLSKADALAARGESRSYEGSTQSIRRTTLTRMAMGTRETDQPPLWIATSDLPTSPGHPFYARLTTLLDGHHFDRFVEGLCDRFYAPVMGRPSLAPGRYFRLLLVGYFEGIDSERGMAWRATDSLAVRSFLRLAVDEAPPDHSTIARTRRLIDLETHRTVFTWVQQRLVEAGRLKGKTIAIDATTLEANAAMRSIVRRDTGESYQAFLAGLATASGIETPTREGLARLDRKRKKKTSNTDWTNPHDPDAKVTKMKDGRTHLAHKAEHAVDMETGAIVAVTLQGADVGDTTTIIETAIAAAEQVEDAQANVDDRQSLEEIVGDKGYHSNQTLIDLAAGGIRSYVSEPDRGRRDWSKDPEARAPVYGNRRRMRGRRGRRLMRQRGERIERSFAHLYDTGGMRRTHLRGHTNILKRLLIHAGGFNLGLVMRHLIGIGTPRGLQGRVAAVLATLGVLMGVVRRRLTTISSSHRLIPAVRGRLASLATFAVNSSAAITCTTGC